MQTYEASGGELTTAEIPAFSLEKEMLVHLGKLLLSVQRKAIIDDTTYITALAKRGDNARFILSLSVPSDTPITTTFVDYDVERSDR